jgi:hypothetical protein
MLNVRRVLLGLSLIALVGISDAWAQATLHIGPGAGSPCATGCGGHPNLFVTPERVDIFQNSGGAPTLAQPVLLIVGVPVQFAPDFPVNPITGVKAINAYPGGTVTPGSAAFAQEGTYGLIAPISDGYFGTMTAGQEVYSFLGLQEPTNNSNSFENWAGFIMDTLGWTVNGFEIHVYEISADLGAKGLIDIKLMKPMPKLNYFVAYGQSPDGSAYSTPLTEAGLSICKHWPGRE